MMRSSLVALLCAALLPNLAACTQTTDLGYPCEMSKQKSGCEGDDCATFIERSEVTDMDLGYPTLDYIAEGAAGCDDLLCLRSRNRRYEEGSKPEDVAMGYCTAPCHEDADCSPDWEGNEKSDLVCKQLLNESGEVDKESQAKYCVRPETEAPGTSGGVIVGDGSENGEAGGTEGASGDTAGDSSTEGDPATEI